MSAVRRGRITLALLQAERRARVAKRLYPEPPESLPKIVACLIAVAAMWLGLLWSLLEVSP